MAKNKNKKGHKGTKGHKYNKKDVKKQRGKDIKYDAPELPSDSVGENGKAEAVVNKKKWNKDDLKTSWKSNSQEPKKGSGVAIHRYLTGNRIVGFFYDTQIKDAAMNCTLHANSWVSGKKEKQDSKGNHLPEWDQNIYSYTQEQYLSGSDYKVKNKDGKEERKMSSKKREETAKKVGLDVDGYFTTPICQSIASEDFQVSISNSWQDFAAGQQITDMFNQIRPIGAYLEWGQEKIDRIVNLTKQAANSSVKNSFAGKAMGVVSSVVGGAANIAKGLKKVMGRSLVVQGTRFSYYCGTGIAMGNLGMKFTIFGAPGFPVHTQLESLYPYVIGHYIKFDPDENIFSGDPAENQTQTVTTTDEDGNQVEKEVKDDPGMVTAYKAAINETLEEFVGWQLPPGGFSPNIKDVDEIQKGTLKLRIGTYYSIPNLVVRDMSLNFSKQMMKSPDKKTDLEIVSPHPREKIYKLKSLGKSRRGINNEISPLFCDVQIQLQPVTKFSDTTMKALVDGSKTIKELSDVNSSIRENLDFEAGLGDKALLSTDTNLDGKRDLGRQVGASRKRRPDSIDPEKLNLKEHKIDVKRDTLKSKIEQPDIKVNDDIKKAAESSAPKTKTKPKTKTSPRKNNKGGGKSGKKGGGRKNNRRK